MTSALWNGSMDFEPRLPLGVSGAKPGGNVDLSWAPWGCEISLAFQKVNQSTLPCPPLVLFSILKEP